MDVVVWLRSLGLGKYEAAFRENDIDDTRSARSTAWLTGAPAQVSLAPDLDGSLQSDLEFRIVDGGEVAEQILPFPCRHLNSGEWLNPDLDNEEKR